MVYDKLALRPSTGTCSSLTDVWGTGQIKGAGQSIVSHEFKLLSNLLAGHGWINARRYHMLVELPTKARAELAHCQDQARCLIEAAALGRITVTDDRLALARERIAEIDRLLAT